MMEKVPTSVLSAERCHLGEGPWSIPSQLAKVVRFFHQQPLPFRTTQFATRLRLNFGLWQHEPFKRVAIECLDSLYFLVGQRGTFIRPCALRQPAILLAQEFVQEIHLSFRHVDDLLQSFAESIVSLEIRNFLRKILFNRLLGNDTAGAEVVTVASA